MTSRIVIALAGGLLFGAGLALSGMTDTRVVLGFLDLAGDWNPALAFVMGGALLITMPGFRLAQRRATPWVASEFHLPTNTRIEMKPLVGATLFGIGWGLYGYCPGPAVASLLTLDWQPALFVAAMAAGMTLHQLTSADG